MQDSLVHSIAETTARALSLDFTPEFVGWRKHGGKAMRRYHNRTNVFDLPVWLKNENSSYQIAYIAHEVCHFAAGLGNGHNPDFYEAERKALSAWCMVPHYFGRNRYVDILFDAFTNEILWSKDTAQTKLRRTQLSWGESR